MRIELQPDEQVDGTLAAAEWHALRRLAGRQPHDEWRPLIIKLERILMEAAGEKPE